jgi:hypothetical protein
MVPETKGISLEEMQRKLGIEYEPQTDKTGWPHAPRN